MGNSSVWVKFILVNLVAVVDLKGGEFEVSVGVIAQIIRWLRRALFMHASWKRSLTSARVDCSRRQIGSVADVVASSVRAEAERRWMGTMRLDISWRWCRWKFSCHQHERRCLTSSRLVSSTSAVSFCSFCTIPCFIPNISCLSSNALRNPQIKRTVKTL